MPAEFVSPTPPEMAGGGLPPVLPMPKGPRWPAVVAWLVVAGCLALISYRNNHSAQLEAATGVVTQLQLKVQAQAYIAAKALAVKSGRPLPESLRDTGRIFARMEREALTPEDQVSLAIFAGEVDGKNAALTRLDTLAATNPAPEIAADIATLRTLYTNGPESLDVAARASLLERYGYFGQLALVYDAPASSTPRQVVEGEAERLLLRLGLLGATVVVVGLLSLGLFITAIVFLVKKKFAHCYTALPSTNSAFLEGFALYLTLYIALGYVIRLFHSTSLLWYFPALLLLPVVVYWTKWRGATADERLRAFGWHPGRGLLQEIGAGLFGYIAGLPIVLIGVICSAILMQVTHIQPRASPLDNLLDKGNAWAALEMYLLACLFAPVMEESMFRGALFHHLRGRWGWLVSAGVTALIFAAIHPYGWVAIPMLASLAMVFAALREWRGSIIATMTAHACHNFMAVTVFLLLMG